MSRPISSLFLMAIGLIAVSSVSEAQESRIHWHIMGGYSETLGTTADFLQGGYLLGHPCSADGNQGGYFVLAGKRI